jgi:cellulose biosynthesis protein BcsQ
MILTIANHKGGVGKTTSVLTMAHLMHLSGVSVNVVDLDAPSTERLAGAAASYRRAKFMGIPAYTLQNLPKGVKGHVLIDGPPDMADPGLKKALKASQLVLIPTTLSFDDLEVSKAFYQGIETKRKLLLFTQVHHFQKRQLEKKRLALRAEGFNLSDTVIPRLELFPRASELKTTVAGIQTKQGRKASEPYAALVKELFS